MVNAADFIDQIGPGLADLCPGDIINWGPGVYNWGYTISLAANGVIHRGSVDANGNPTTIMTGDNQRRCLTFFGVEVYENMVFEDGVASGDGGAFILNPGFGKVTFRNCVFRNNTAGSLGGAVCNLAPRTGLNSLTACSLATPPAMPVPALLCKWCRRCHLHQLRIPQQQCSKHRWCHLHRWRFTNRKRLPVHQQHWFSRWWYLHPKW